MPHFEYITNLWISGDTENAGEVMYFHYLFVTLDPSYYVVSTASKQGFQAKELVLLLA